MSRKADEYARLYGGWLEKFFEPVKTCNYLVQAEAAYRLSHIWRKIMDTNKKLEVVLEKDKTTKGSNRFSGENGIVPSVYIRKPFFATCSRVRVTIERVEEDAQHG